MDDLDKIYQFNESIKQLRNEMLRLVGYHSERFSDGDPVVVIQLEAIRSKYNEITREKNKYIRNAYAGSIVRTNEQPVHLCTPSKMKITAILIGKDSTKLTMAPDWFKPDNEKKVLRTIRYPKKGSNKHQCNTIARFRTVKTESTNSNNFNNNPIHVEQQATETLILALDAFVNQFNGTLSFTTEDLSFVNSAERAACGVADLGSTHLLVNENISSAQFTLAITISYDDLAKSEETMGQFTSAFANAIAADLGCENNYVRVTGIKKSTKGKGKADVNLVLTTPDKTKTKELADTFKEHARLGFADDTILSVVKPDEYDCKWMPILSFLQLKPQDFDPKYNFDYTRPNLPETDTRGNLPYYLPIGWYRHALRVSDRYEKDDNDWLGSNNGPNEWPVAFHGTKSHAVRGITDEGLLSSKVQNDAKREEAIQLEGDDADKPGLYVATHCNGGSHPLYTSKFDVKKPNGETESFHVVFQCRVRPNPKSYTEYTSPVQIGHAWRITNPTYIRPYGILLKSTSIKVPFE